MAQNVTDLVELDEPTPGEHAALLALLSTATVTAASEQSGLSRATLHRYLQNPDFVAKLRQMRESVIQSTTAALTASSTSAVEQLAAILADPQSSDKSKIDSAKAVLFEMRQLTEMDRNFVDLLDLDLERQRQEESERQALGALSDDEIEHLEQLTRFVQDRNAARLTCAELRASVEALRTFGEHCERERGH